jgi:tRNA 5-methylaminomethyl-2-thiouridine biosynthesis bifunctional protein
MGIDIAKIMPLRNIRGQLSYFQIDQPWPLTSVLCGAGYILPAGKNKFVVGATYDENDSDLTVRTTSHQENWQRFKLLLAQDTAMLGHQQMTIQGGFVGQRCVAVDRLPLIGAWPDIANALTHARKVSADLKVMPRCAGLYTALALGSRGLIWSALASEILASQIMGAPAPIAQDLLQALDPARFFLRYLRSL